MRSLAESSVQEMVGLRTQSDSAVFAVTGVISKFSLGSFNATNAPWAPHVLDALSGLHFCRNALN